MDVFQNYGKYYDLLYQDKDYQSEANFLIDVLSHRGIEHDAKLLELGSGTGKHAVCLAEQGYYITGVEQSDSMLELAGQTVANHNPQIAHRIKLLKGDIRTWQCEQDRKFDAAFSLFHVMSYLPELADIKSVFSNLKKQVKKNGIFIFDCWYGPAVLNLKPEMRYKVMTDGQYTIERIAEPKMRLKDHQVTIDYTLFAKDSAESHYQKFKEQHKMRFLFKSEVELLCEHFDCQLLDCFEWLTKAPLSEDTWGACFVIKV